MERDGEALRIFCAALQGITANRAFFSPLYQQRADLAVQFARECVREAYRNDPKRLAPDLSGAGTDEGEGL